MTEEAEFAVEYSVNFDQGPLEWWVQDEASSDRCGVFRGACVWLSLSDTMKDNYMTANTASSAFLGCCCVQRK